jgi:1-acyl-sn-glycerol-3-phosphate acyltransferase
MKKKWFINLALGFVKITGVLPALLFFKPRIIKSTNAPKKLPKPCILVSNHKSLMDFALFQILFPFRTIRFLMAEVLYNKSSFFAWFLNSLGGIRVDRDDRNFSFVSDSIEVLDNGGTLGVFPEGRLPVNGKPWPFTVSTAFIATHADSKIVPVYIDGNYGITKRATAVIGEPFYLTDHIKEGLDENAQLEHLTAILEQKVYALKTLAEDKK